MLEEIVKCRIKINGKLYIMTVDSKGRETYDPPLPQSIIERGERNMQDIRKGKIAKLRTDATFMAGRGSLRDQFKGDEAWLRRYAKEYKKRTGRSMPENAAWIGQLADDPFDPRALVESAADQKKLIQRRADKVNRENDAPPIRLAEDLVVGEMERYRAEGDTSPADELRHMVIERHGQKV